jgi:hypothetical protein
LAREKRDGVGEAVVVVPVLLLSLTGSREDIFDLWRVLYAMMNVDLVLGYLTGELFRYFTVILR